MDSGFAHGLIKYLILTIFNKRGGEVVVVVLVVLVGH